MLASSRTSGGPPTNASVLSRAASSSRILETGAEPEVVHLSSSKRILFVATCAADIVSFSGPCAPGMRQSEGIRLGSLGLYGTI